jgi:AAA+ superfamily predicted ATPase
MRLGQHSAFGVECEPDNGTVWGAPVADGDLLRRLFLSHKRRDDQAFAQVARDIIAEERGKHHNLLADELEAILEGTYARKTRRVPGVSSHRFEELPRDRERDSLLLEIRTPSSFLSDIVLTAENRCAIEDILREQRQRDLLRTHGLPPRRHLLLCGPPGCGKTLCAEVLARELDLPLLYARFDAIVSSYLGETAANLRKVFDYAARGAWVLFFDEFDAIGKSRDDLAEHGELKRVVNTFLQLLDSFNSESLVIAATNHEDLLDPALWRRFDEVLYFGLPTPKQVAVFLEMKLAPMHHPDVDLEQVVPQLTGLTYADIERICIDAMKLVVLAGHRGLTPEVFDRAIDQQKRRLALVGAKSVLGRSERGNRD